MFTKEEIDRQAANPVDHELHQIIWANTIPERRVLPMSHRKCFRDAAHNATPPPLPPITTHSRSRAQLKSSNCMILLQMPHRLYKWCSLETESLFNLRYRPRQCVRTA
ncbi:hypothetical protein J6590_062954 [Homalodisca vitripennis]|nr:hypothetical protein J6590_062954 [Homalodisca vitripennis]